LLELEKKNIQDVLNVSVHLSGGQKRKLIFGIAILGDPQVSQTKFIDKFRITRLSFICKGYLKYNSKILTIICFKITASFCAACFHSE
jgi:hypothetical protein